MAKMAKTHLPQKMPLADWAYNAPPEQSETELKLSYLRRGHMPPPSPPPQTSEDIARELLGQCVEIAFFTRPRPVDPKQDMFVRVTKNADNLYHAVAAARAMRGRDDKTREQLREDAVGFMSKRFPWPGMHPWFDEYLKPSAKEARVLDKMFQSTNEKGVVPSFIAELTTERLRSKETGVIPPPPTNFRGFGMPRAFAKMQDDRRRHRKPDLVFQPDPYKYLPDAKWDDWRRRQQQLLTKEERGRDTGWEELENAIVAVATIAMKEARERGQLADQIPDAEEAALATYRQWAPRIKTWSQVNIDRSINILGSSGNDEAAGRKILEQTVANPSILTLAEEKELEMPYHDKEYGGREVEFHEWFCAQAASCDSFATFYELEALAWSLPEKVPIVIYYRRDGKVQPPRAFGPVPLDPAKTDARPYELLWSGNDLMLFNPIVPRQLYDECQRVADNLSKPHDWLTEDHFKKTNISRPCYELAKKTMTDGNLEHAGLTCKEVAERLEITEEDVRMMEKQIELSGHDAFMMADDKRARCHRTKRRREECAHKAVSFKMQIIERPDLFYQEPVTKRHRVERTAKDEKLFVDHLKDEGFTADDVYTVCKAFKNGTPDGPEGKGRWPMPGELAPLLALSARDNQMSSRTAGRLFDQAMEEVSHWPLVPDPKGLWWPGGPMEA